MAFGSAAWACGLQTLHAVVSERGSESGLGGRVPEILQPGQENAPVVTVPPPTASVEMARQPAQCLAFIPHLDSQFPTAASPGWPSRWLARMVVVVGGERERACGPCKPAKGVPCLGLALARGTPRGRRMDGYHEGKRVREDKRLEGSVCDGPGLPVRGRDRGT
jgi:hypothetical protein